MKNKVLLILCAVILIVVSFISGGYLFHPNSIVPNFDTSHKDSLYVTRVMSKEGEKWYTQDSTAIIEIYYLQLNGNERCCQLFITSNGMRSDGYNGMFFATDEGLRYCFADPGNGTCIQICDYAQPCMIINGNSINLLRIGDID